MEIKSVLDKEFAPYGRIHEGYDLDGLLVAMDAIPLPEEGTAYQPSMEGLEAQPVFGQLEGCAYGGMPVQLGMCWGPAELPGVPPGQRVQRGD